MVMEYLSRCSSFLVVVVSISYCFTPIKADVIQVENDQNTFATNYSLEMNSIGIGITPSSPRFWSVNNILVYGVVCNAITFECFDQSVPANDFIVTSSVVASSNSVNTTIQLRYDQESSLEVKIVDRTSTNISMPVYLELKDCSNKTSVNDDNVDLSTLSESYTFGVSVVVGCATSEDKKVSLICNSHAEWSQNGTCPLPETTKSPTEPPPTEPPITEPPITEEPDKNTKEIGGACLGAIVISSFSIIGSIVCIVVIILLGSDFVKEKKGICGVGGCFMVLGIVCGAVPLRSCPNSVIWIGGDIASIVLGSIGTLVTLIFLVYLIVVRCNPEYTLGKAR